MTAELDRIAPVIDDLGDAVRGGRPRAGAGRRSGARRDARPAAQRPRLHHLRAARARPSGCSTAGPTRSGTWAATSAPSAAARATGPVEITTYRSEAYDPASRKPTVDFGDTLDGRPRPPRLHRQRDGGAAAGPRSSRTRTAAWSTSRSGCCARRAARGLLLRRPAADDAGGAVRRAARLHGRARGGRRDDARWPSGSRSSRPSGSATSWSSWSARRTPGAGWPCSSRPGSPTLRAARAAGARARARRAPPAQGRLRAHAHRAGAGDRPRGPAARRRPGLRVAVRGADARRRQAADPALPRRRHGDLPPPRRGRRQDHPQADEGAALLQRRDRRGRPSWSSCTCASTATARASGPTPPYAATCATPATSSSGCTC